MGQRIRIFVNDASTRGRRRLQQGPVPSGGARRLAGALATARGAPATRPTITKDGNVTLVTQLPPAWVAAHPVYQAAMEGALLLDAGDAGEGLTAQQALAAERAAAGEGPAAAAADWTVVSWLYGMNNVDSGGRTGVIDKDEIALSFR